MLKPTTRTFRRVLLKKCIPNKLQFETIFSPVVYTEKMVGVSTLAKSFQNMLVSSRTWKLIIIYLLMIIREFSSDVESIFLLYS